MSAFGVALRSSNKQLLVCKTLVNSSAANYASNGYSVNLKEVLAKKIPEHNKKVQDFRKQYGDKVVQNITVDMIYGGMRSMKAMVTETSVLDPEEGIRFRGFSIPECQEKLPKAQGGQEPKSRCQRPSGGCCARATFQTRNK